VLSSLNPFFQTFSLEVQNTFVIFNYFFLKLVTSFFPSDDLKKRYQDMAAFVSHDVATAAGTLLNGNEDALIGGRVTVF
jgi:hypothetical protein